MTATNNFSAKVQEELKYYVYRLIDPRNGKTFYVGKGSGNRVFDHEKNNPKQDCPEDLDLQDCPEDLGLKNETIKSIKDSGLEVIKVIHCWGLNEEVAFGVEDALINAYHGLTNKNCPDEPINVEQAEKYFNVEETKIDSKVLIIKIKQKTIDERGSVYEAVRRSWVLSVKNAKQAEYIFAVRNGIIVGVYKAKEWKDYIVNSATRHGFEGEEAPENIKLMHIGKLIPQEYRKKGAASPIRYSWNIYSKKDKK